VTHEQAWQRLPDLLGSHDDAALLAHVAGCHACQRQLFLLGRVDRMLHDARRNDDGGRLPSFRMPAVVGALGAVAVLAALAVLPFLPNSAADAFVLRAADGRTLGSAKLVRVDRSNVEVSLVARGMTAPEGDQLLLWARSRDGAGAIRVGRFMVARGGECRAHFRISAGHRWTRFWITSPSDPAIVVATT
jgi:hypothetical protein